MDDITITQVNERIDDLEKQILEFRYFDKKKYSQQLIREYLMNGKMNEYFFNDNTLLTSALFNLRDEVKAGVNYRELGDNEILAILGFLKRLARDWKNDTISTYDIDTQMYQYLKNLKEQKEFIKNEDKEWDIVREMINVVLNDHS